MLGLPSTTEVNKRFPKEAFYSHLKLDRRTKEEFISRVERIVLTNSVKPGTANVIQGKVIKEILVFNVQLKTSILPLLALESIARTNSNAIIFVCQYEDEMSTVVFRQGCNTKEGAICLELGDGNLDVIWDSYVSQLIYGEPTAGDLDARISHTHEITVLEADIARLRNKCMKTKQIGEKNELFEQMKVKQTELDELKRAGA